jgi:hypothetical protein
MRSNRKTIALSSAQYAEPIRSQSDCSYRVLAPAAHNWFVADRPGHKSPLYLRIPPKSHTTGGASEQLQWRLAPYSWDHALDPRLVGLIHSDDSQIDRSSSSSRHESRNCGERHESGSRSA